VYAYAQRILIVCALAAVAAAQAPAPMTARIDIDAARVEGRISPLLYGQFIEYMFEGVKRGLHAELLRDRGFEEPPNAIGLSHEWERYPDDRDDDYGINFSQDEGFGGLADGSGGKSLRVELRPAVIARHGVYQARVPIRQGVEYRGYVWMKTRAFAGEVRASLEADAAGGAVYAEARVADLAATDQVDEWKQFAFTLKPTASDPLARVALLFSGSASGTVWIDQLSLMPADAAPGGVRADVFERVKALAPAFIRWPGGNVAQDYHWQWGIGPRDRRPMWINLAWKRELEPSDFGTDEFIAFARAVGAEPTITVNVEGGGATVEEAAAWVEYCNGPASSRYGAIRARDGHPEPYRVKYWEIGNEIWGDWVRGHSDATTYARNLARYVAAMRAVDPSIEIIAVGDNDMTWNRIVLREREHERERFDYLAIHHYYGRKQMGDDLHNLMARPLHYAREYDEIAEIMRSVALEHHPMLAINEWGLDLPESQQYSILAALYAARLMNVFERRSDLVGMTAVSDLVNGWPGGIIQASRHGTFVTPIYLVNKLYATHLGAERLTTRVDGPTFSTSGEGRDIPTLDAVASRSADGRSLFIKVVNTDLERPATVTIAIRGAQIAPHATVDRVTADSLEATNGFATPDAIKTTHEDISISSPLEFRLELPRHSIAVITLTLTAR
jgi:alpha-N-arabinofuranosidase